MNAKILQMPKSNQQLWDDLFNSFIDDWDKAHGRLGASAGCYGSGEPTADDGYAEIARRDFERQVYEECDREDAARMGYVDEDGGYIPDEPGCSDSDTARELQQSRGKAE